MLALSSQAFAGGTWHKSVAAAQKAAAGKKQLILVDMFAEWCGWCHRFEREVFPSEVFQNATNDIVLLRLDTEDKGEGTQFARKYGVAQLPTFLLLTHDLNLAGMIRGYAPPDAFVKSLKETRGKYTDFLQRVKNEPAIAKDYVKRLDLAKEFLERGAYDKSDARFRTLATEKGVPVVVRDGAYYELALSYALQRRYDEGLKTIRELTSISKSGDAVEGARVLAGQIYLSQGNLQAAVNEFRSFKKMYPNSVRVAQIDSFLPQIEQQLAASGK